MWALLDLARVDGPALESVYQTAAACHAAAARLLYLTDGLADPVCRAFGA